MPTSRASQAYRVYRAPEPRMLDRPVRNTRGGWRREEPEETLAILIEDGSWPIDLTALAQRSRAARQQRERDERRHRVVAGLVLLMGIAGVVIFIATH